MNRFFSHPRGYRPPVTFSHAAALALGLAFSPLTTLAAQGETASVPSDLTKKILRLAANPDEVCTVPVGTEAITTVSFQANILGIDGVGFADSVDQAKTSGAGFVIAHRPSTRYFTLLALKRGARSNLTVQVGQTVLTLYCVQDDSAPWHVKLDGAAAISPAQANVQSATQPAASPVLLAASQDAGPAPTVDKQTLADLLTQLQARIESGQPGAIPDHTGTRPMTSVDPASESSQGSVSTKIVRVCRDEDLDALLFAVQITNQGNEPYYYDPEGFGVQLSDGVQLKQAASISVGVLMAGQSQNIYFAVCGRGDGRRNNVPPNASFALTARAIRFNAEAVRRAAPMEPRRRESARRTTHAAVAASATPTASPAPKSSPTSSKSAGPTAATKVTNKKPASPSSAPSPKAMETGSKFASRNASRP